MFIIPAFFCGPTITINRLYGALRRFLHFSTDEIYGDNPDSLYYLYITIFCRCRSEAVGERC